MITRLLRTKYALPAPRPSLVPRKRLDVLLTRFLQVPLTLVSAPPGFGKTSAVLAGVHALAEAKTLSLAWLALDPEDDDPNRFWLYWLAALRAADPQLDAHLPEWRPPMPTTPDFLTDVLNEITQIGRPLLMVLDDYHLINQPEIHNGLAFILDHAPPNLHLVLTTRADPPLPLHRWRARGKVLEIRTDHLRFDAEETHQLLSQIMGLSLSAAAAHSLTEQTEGWAAGLQLAGLALQAAPGSAQPELINRLAHSNRYILDYLADEVLALLPPETQSFLLQTSVLEALNGSLCEAVTGRPDSTALLGDLARRNLFIVPTGPDVDPWYRCHGLFRDLLRGQLRQQQPERIPALHQQAARWFERAGEPDAAIEHALSAADYPYAAQMMEQCATAIAMQGRTRTLEGWLSRMPPGWPIPPRVECAFGWALLMRGRYAEIEPHLQRAESSLPPEESALRAEWYALRAALADSRGQAPQALEYARSALAHADPDDQFTQAVAHTALASALRTRGDLAEATSAYEHALALCTAVGLLLPELLSRAHLGTLYMLQGQLQRAETVTRPAADMPHPLSSAARAALAEVLLEWNRLPEAEAHTLTALHLAQTSGHHASSARTLILLARLRRAQHDPEAAAVALEAAAAEIARGAPTWIEPLRLAAHIHLLLDEGHVQAAEHLVRTHPLNPPTANRTDETFDLARLRLLLHQQQWRLASDQLDNLIANVEADGRTARLIEGRLYRALTAQAAGDRAGAHHHLNQALESAEAEGYIRLFVEAGPHIPMLLTDSPHPYAQRVLAAFPTELHPVTALVEALTEREVEVLRCMARGLSYQEMAAELVISINTVRHHIKAIYTKLDANTRTRAIERARSLRLI